MTSPAAGRVAVVHVGRGQRRQLEERRTRVEQLLDPLADRQLALAPVALQIPLAAALPGDVGPPLQLGHELRHPVAVLLKLRGVGRMRVSRRSIGRGDYSVFRLKAEAAARRTYRRARKTATTSPDSETV